MSVDWSVLQDACLDALVDSLKMLPLLFAIYVLIEFAEGRWGERLNAAMARAGRRFGPVVGALAGIIPQCGVSMVGAVLYTQRIVTVGTFAAIYLATSDEAIPVILSQPDALPLLWPLIGCKLVIAVAVGYALDAVVRRRATRAQAARAHLAGNGMLAPQAATAGGCAWAGAPQAADAGGLATAMGSPTGTTGDLENTHITAIPAGTTAPASPRISPASAGAASPASQDIVARETPVIACGCECCSGSGEAGVGASGRMTLRSLLWAPFVHTMQVFVFIFLTSLVLALLFALVGQETIAAALAGHSVLQPVLATLVGLIPNCAASVAITELYVERVITFGACLAGLLANGGLGMLVLLREGARREALGFLAVMLAVSVAAGLVVQAIPA